MTVARRRGACKQNPVPERSCKKVQPIRHALCTHMPSSPARCFAGAPAPGGWQMTCPRDKQCRILVIEDHRDAADTLRVVLQIEGHDVRVCYNGEDGLETADKWRPHVIFLDLA